MCMKMWEKAGRWGKDIILFQIGLEKPLHAQSIAFDKKLHISHAYYNVTLQANYYAPHVNELIYKIAKLAIGK